MAAFVVIMLASALVTLPASAAPSQDDGPEARCNLAVFGRGFEGWIPAGWVVVIESPNETISYQCDNGFWRVTGRDRGKPNIALHRVAW